MFDTIGLRARELVLGQLRSMLRRLDTAELSGPQAVELLEWFGQVERLAAAGRALVAGRAVETNQWRRDGDRSPEHWLARRSGTTVTAARDALDTARRLRALPATDAAVRSGHLSPQQAAVVTDAASADPDAEQSLLDAAAGRSLAELRTRAEEVKANARSAEVEEEREERIRRSRSLRRSVGTDGAHELHARGTAVDIATFWSRLQPFVDTEFANARGEGRRESSDAYAFDALLAMAATASDGGDGEPGDAAGGDHDPEAGDGTIASDATAATAATTASRSSARSRSRSNTKVIVRVDLSAIRRGTTVPGEVCDIPGFGPIPVSEALKLMNDAFLSAVLTKGRDVHTVVHFGRQFTEFQKTALEWRDPECCVDGCGATARLERDHRDDWAATRQTWVQSADRLCHHHHLLKTTGWRLEPGTGKRWLLPPPEPAPDRAEPAPAMANGP